ncbi:MAG TPA: NUDIX hydrolase [Candidatus Goldiibacteriota bacterium]|nr:NUDIX hydrolase [Candidatus Goldiibacteriota bacterium]
MHKKKELIYKGRVFSLYKKEIKIGKRRTIREIVEHPGSAVIIPVLDRKKPVIVLIRQYRYAAGKWLIELPAGTRDEGESSLACAKREIIEETGYKAARIRKIASFYPSAGMMTEKMDLFFGHRPFKIVRKGRL